MSSYTLNYFNGRGRAELTRLIFAAAGAKFTDKRVEFAEWPALKEKSPLGQMPYLEVDNHVLPQSIAIARFVAREHGLAGSTNLKQAQADAIVDTITDLINFYYSKVFPIQDAAEKEAAFKAFMGDQGAKGAANIEKLISLYGSNGFSVGDSLTWADLFIFDLTTALLTKNPEFTTQFPLIAGVHATVSKNENVSNYVKNRPVTPF